MYVYVRIDAWDFSTKNGKQHPSPGDDASTAEAASGRVGRDEEGEASRETPYRMIDLISSGGVYRSKLGLNMSYRLV